MEIEIRLKDGRTVRVSVPFGATLSSSQLKVLMSRVIHNGVFEALVD